MPPLSINIRPHESATIIGRKGSGKTVGMNKILEASKPTGQYRNIILDTKQVGDYAKYPSVSELKNLSKMVAENGTVVYAPNDYEAKSDDHIEGFFAYCYRRWNTRIVIDEMSSILNGNDVPDSYRDVTDRGRAKHVTLLQGTQKPVFVPHSALSEADHFLIFDLIMEADRRKVSTLGMGNVVMQRPKDPYGFWYYCVRDANPVYCPGFTI